MSISFFGYCISNALVHNVFLCLFTAFAYILPFYYGNCTCTSIAYFRPHLNAHI